MVQKRLLPFWWVDVAYRDFEREAEEYIEAVLEVDAQVRKRIRAENRRRRETPPRRHP
jgi:hypothetical protein